MITELKSFLLEKAGEWDLPKSGEWRFLFNNNYHPHCSNLNLLWFHNGGHFPRVVTKLFREPQLPEREFQNLKQVYAGVPELVPQPLYFGAQGAFWALWMKGVPGLRVQVHKGHSPDTLRALVEMVTSMHGGVQKREARPDPDRRRRIVLEPLQNVAQFGASSAVRAGCADIEARSTLDWVNSLPVIPQHGDLFFNNVLTHKGQYCIVDWESYGTIDLPFYDLFTLLFSMLRAKGETPDEWDSTLRAQVPALVECYAGRLGLGSSNIALLFPLTLVNWFHLQWCDGRKEFTDLMYKTLQHYFEYIGSWEKVFVPTTNFSRSA